MKTKVVKGYYGLEYVTVILPLSPSKHGDVIAVDVGKVEKSVARLLIEKGVPLRGLEIKFLRKALGLSLERFGAELGISAPAVLKWEKLKAEVRLEPMNEVAVRALLAEKLGVKLSGKFSVLRGEETVTPFRLRAG